MQKHFEEVAGAISIAERIALASHVNPDGDALGSILALAHVLKGLGKDVTVLLQDGVPDIYRWMPGQEWVQRETERHDFDLAIVCDAGALERVGKTLIPIVLSAKTIVDIDHHVADGVFGNVQLLDSTASATAEILAEFLKSFSARVGQNVLTKDVAICLMTGIITDTGSFRYLSVTPRTFELSAELQRLGAIPAPITELVFENRSRASVKLLGRALDSLQLSPDGRIAWARVTAQDFADLAATDEDTEGIVSHVRAISGVQIGILFREIPGKKVRISLRARDGADVNRIANVFGGGGHKLAAGCSVEPPLAEVERQVVSEAMRQLDATPVTQAEAQAALLDTDVPHADAEEGTNPPAHLPQTL